MHMSSPKERIIGIHPAVLLVLSVHRQEAMATAGDLYGGVTGGRGLCGGRHWRLVVRPHGAN